MSLKTELSSLEDTQIATNPILSIQLWQLPDYREKQEKTKPNQQKGKLP